MALSKSILAQYKKISKRKVIKMLIDVSSENAQTKQDNARLRKEVAGLMMQQPNDPISTFTVADADKLRDKIRDLEKAAQSQTRQGLKNSKSLGEICRALDVAIIQMDLIVAGCLDYSERDDNMSEIGKQVDYIQNKLRKLLGKIGE